MTRLNPTSALAIVVVFTFTPAAFASLLVDFNTTGNALDDPFVQTGYEAFTEVASPESGDNAADNATTDGTIEQDGITETRSYVNNFARTGTDVHVTIARFAGGDNLLDFRTRDAITSGAFTDRSNLLRDNVLTTNFKLTIGNLAAGTYQITTYHHDSQFGGGQSQDFDIRVTDANETNRFVANDVVVSTGTSTSAVTAVTFSFELDQTTDAVVIDFLDVAGGNPNIALNGFDLIIPEPGAAALLGLGGLMISGRFRR